MITLATVKDFLKIGDTSFDAFLTEYITLKSKQIEEFLRCDVIEKTNTVTCNGSGLEWVWFPKRPWSAWNTSEAKDCVEVRESPTSAFVALTTDSLNVIPEPHRVHVAGSIFPTGLQNVRLKYKSGYSTIPAVFQDACLKEVVRVYLDSIKGGKARVGMASEGVSTGGVGTTTTYLDISDEVKKMLSGFVWHGPATH
jgi:hypothetical protein